jgi:N-acetylglucosamine kinase-like BadF-type ATPase
MIVATADVGGSKTTIRLTDGDRELARNHGPGAAVRPGRALVTAASVADLIRQTVASCGLVRVDTIVIGAAGAGNPADADEIRLALVHDQIAARVIVTTDVLLALSALGVASGAILVAGTGSIALGRTAAGELVRQGGFGWRMGDEGSGYWIGHEALRAVGAAHDGRGDRTTLTDRLVPAARAVDFRGLVAWSTVADPREVAGLVPAVIKAADDGDPIATRILDEAAAKLADLVQRLGAHFSDPGTPLALSGGLIATDGRLRRALVARVSNRPPFTLRTDPLDPLEGGPRLATE